MTRDQFLRERRADWQRFEVLLARAEAHRRPSLPGSELVSVSKVS